MDRTTIPAALLAASLALPALAADTRNPLTDSPTWQSLRGDVTGEAAIAPAEGLFTVSAPYRAEDAATVRSISCRPISRPASRPPPW